MNSASFLINPIDRFGSWIVDLGHLCCANNAVVADMDIVQQLLALFVTHGLVAFHHVVDSCFLIYYYRNSFLAKLSYTSNVHPVPNTFIDYR